MWVSNYFCKFATNKRDYMFLERILITDFKNIHSAELHFSPKLNCIWGSNGEGKTNLLDAIYYLSMTKSYFNGSDVYTFKRGCNYVALNGIYDEDSQKCSISIGIKGTAADDGTIKVDEKVVKRDGKNYGRISEHIGRIPVVVVSPTDTELINSGGDERRRFINMVLSQLDSEYLRKLQNYNQLLLQRNKLLKMVGADVVSSEYIETIDERMAVNAEYIYSERVKISGLLNDSVCKYYNILSNSKENVSFEYRSQLASSSTQELFRENFEKDRILKYTSSGIHRDDFLFSVNGMPIKNCGSQGQQKTFLIALKLAQYEIMLNLHGKQPLLLLDDVFDKLDMGRVGRLIEVVSGSGFGQIFITDSSKVRMESVLEPVLAMSRNFTVENGVFQLL